LDARDGTGHVARERRPARALRAGARAAAVHAARGTAAWRAHPGAARRADLVPRRRARGAGRARRSTDAAAVVRNLEPRLEATMTPRAASTPALRAQGFVFALDGTLTSNMPLHAEAFARFTERHGLPPFPLEMRARLDGKRNSDIFPILFERSLSA